MNKKISPISYNKKKKIIEKVIAINYELDQVLTKSGWLDIGKEVILDTGLKNKNIVSFELTMPNKGSWNGKWTGEDRRYLKIKTLTKESLMNLLGNEEISSFHHNFGDGWSAQITVKRINSKEKASLQKYLNNGFCGYEWMIDNILSYGSIKEPEIPIFEGTKKQLEDLI